MAISIDPISAIPTPPTKADPQNFATRADGFLGSLPVLVQQLNAMISEVNKITSGLDQTEPIIAWEGAPTSYSFPDVVAGSNGETYRCIDVDVVNINPVDDTEGVYWLQLTNNQPDPELPPDRAYIGIGDIKISLKPNPETEYMFICDGRALSRSEYSDLFDEIGTTWGAGNGSTTFNIPDFRNEFLRGASSTRAVGSKASDSFRSHTHSGSTNNTGGHQHSYTLRTTSGVFGSGSHSADRNDSTAYTGSAGGHSHSVSIGSTGGAETAPRHAVVNFLIRVL